MRRNALLIIAAIGVADNAAFAATALWWDTAYSDRFNVAVIAGVNAPDKGYAAYTARIPNLDTLALIAAGEMLADCSDLRITYYDGIVWQDLPRHVLGCNSANTDVRFSLGTDIAAGASDDNYYLYHGNASPGSPPPMDETNVYLWFDDATIDRTALYIRGRTDDWHGTGWDNSLSWNPAGYYVYDNGDNFTSGYRRTIDERDVFIEAEFYHTGCYQFNVTTGLLVRGSALAGSPPNEATDNYYASNRGEYPGCSAGGYPHDGDIVIGNRPTIAVDGTNPPDIAANTWRRQALAVWLTNPNNLAFWDEDSSALWAALGFPSNANLQLGGTHSSGVNGRGFAAIMTAQDQARIRNILIRRFVDPEPQLTLTSESQPPAIVLQKTVLTVFDPINNVTNPKAIPGSWIDYTISASNNGAGAVDTETLLVTEPLAASVTLFVGDLVAAGDGPVEFIDGSGSSASGLSFVFGGLTDLTDDVEFSINGADYSYVPIADANGFDSAVRFIRIRPSGTFYGAAGATATRFDLRLRVRMQ